MHTGQTCDFTHLPASASFLIALLITTLDAPSLSAVVHVRIFHVRSDSAPLSLALYRIGRNSDLVGIRSPLHEIAPGPPKPELS